MSKAEADIARSVGAGWRDFYELTKPRVVMLIVFTAVVGMLLAVPAWPPLDAFVFGTLGIGLASSSAAAINQIIDARVDAQMKRTQHRPLVQGSLSERQAMAFAAALGVISMVTLWTQVNPLTAVLTFASLIGYAVIYTVYLKPATPQNIVIGGAAGAAPPVLGWVAVTGDVHAHSLLLFLIIFVWTPPHFWALAIAKRDDYAKVGTPMLPVTHGVPYTKLSVLLYTILLVLVTLLPWLSGMTGLIYLAGTLLLGAEFMRHAVSLYLAVDDKPAMPTFVYSINYLMLLFGLLLADHYLWPLVIAQ
ncbi:MAG: heme o synthase [Pseudomonadota bacterium]